MQTVEGQSGRDEVQGSLRSPKVVLFDVCRQSMVCLCRDSTLWVKVKVKVKVWGTVFAGVARAL